MTQHHLFDNVDFVNFPNVKRKPIQGVYCIGGKYVGASTNIRNRIISHINSARGRWGHVNKEVGEMILEGLKEGNRLTVEFLDEDPEKEVLYARQFGEYNKSSNFYHMKVEDSAITKQLKKEFIEEHKKDILAIPLEADDQFGLRLRCAIIDNILYVDMYNLGL